MSTDYTPTTFDPLAGAASLLLPGAGHFVRGERTRALLIAAGVLGLFFGGIFIGGIDVIDSREDRLWFIGQALVGPLAFGVDHAHQTRFKGFEIPDELREARRLNSRQLSAFAERPRSAFPDETRELVTFQITDPAAGSAASVTLPVFRTLSREELDRGLGPPNRKSLSKVNELGTLFATIAGMLNLIVILDAAFPSVRARRVAAPATAPADDPVRGAAPQAAR